MSADANTTLTEQLERLGLAAPPPFVIASDHSGKAGELARRFPSHVCTAECKDGKHVLEFAITPGVKALLEQSTAPEFPYPQ